MSYSSNYPAIDGRSPQLICSWIANRLLGARQRHSNGVWLRPKEFFCLESILEDVFGFHALRNTPDAEYLAELGLFLGNALLFVLVTHLCLEP